MSDPNMPDQPAGLSRRQFVQATAAAGAGLVLSAPLWAQANAAADDLNVAIIGAGSQGRNLVINALKIPGIRFKAVCDIWNYHQKYCGAILKKFDHDANIYEDYRQMLAEEKDLDAVIIASPDFVHAEHTNACLAAGLHVYCEKEMANTLDASASMVKAAAKSGKLLQIGHQRRSNPRYHLAHKLIHNDKVCGRITHFNGQWNRRHRLELGWPKNKPAYILSDEKLKQYGYGSMDEFRNWRWYRKYSGGPMADLGSHQIDVFSWMLEADPASVFASGGIDYYTEKNRDWYDNVLATYVYQTKQDDVAHTVRGFYQVLNTTSFGDYYETFMGDEGTLVISEDTRKGYYFREPTSNVRRQWEDEAETVSAMGREAIELKVGESLSAKGDDDPEAQQLLADVNKPPHQLHLENFFNAVRAGGKKEMLSCPAEVGYATAVAVLAANRSIDDNKQIDFEPDQFEA